MDPVRNPFAPGAGTPPPAFAGRDELLTNVDVVLARIKEGRPAKSMFFVGLRGVGKTVLLNHVQRVAEDKYGYRSVFIEAPENRSLPGLLIPQLVRLLNTLTTVGNITDKTKAALRALAGFARAFKVTYEGLELSFDAEAVASTDIQQELPVVMVALGEAAESAGKPVLILIDEMQYLPAEDFAALISAMHKVAQRQLPLVLIGAGLPQLIGTAGDAKSYAERLFDFPRIGPLAQVDAANAITAPIEREGVKIEKAAVDKIFAITQGYPYFLQEWGSEVWNVARNSPITVADVDKALPTVIKRLDQSFFSVRLDRLTTAEKNYLYAMSQLGPGPHRSGDIAAALGRDVTNAAPIRKSLILKGMIYSRSHGDTAFTVPLFDEFMKRAMAPEALTTQ